MDARTLWSRILVIVGGAAMLVGAIDPLEGSVLILPGSALFALGAFVGQVERAVIVRRVWVFILIATGVGAIWGLTAVGGFGGATGRSNWWGVLILPYLMGWSMGIWGRGSPRWMVWLGMVVSLWYLTLAAKIQMDSAPQHRDYGLSIVLAALALLTMGGCINRLRKRISARQ